MMLFIRKHKNVLLVRLLILLAIIWQVTACKNDIETVNALTSELELPDLSGYNIELTFTDSGMLKGRITAPEVHQYLRVEEPYYEFPKGMKTVFYDVSGQPKSFIQAKYAIFYENRQLWEARNQVVAESPAEGKKLETEHMFWNQREKIVYSENFTKMTNPNGVFTGEFGFEAREDLSHWELKGLKGKVNVPDLQPETPTDQ
ncbi:MAG: LPS export ABC transporter periplasmic protein LptC [Bacteroidales bacterium]